MDNKYKILIISFLLAFVSTKADITSDTLKLKSMANDTAKCNLLNQVSENLKVFNTDLGIEYGNRGLKLANDLNYTKGKADANKSIGLNYWLKGHYDVAAKYYFASLSIYESLKDTFGIGRIYNNFGILFFARNQHQKAIDYLYRALTIYLKLNDDRELSRVYHNLGLVKSNFSMRQEAQQDFYKSIDLAIKSNDSVLLAYNYCFLGRNFTKLKQFENAKQYLDKSISIYLKLNIPNHIGMVYNQLADYHNEIKDYKNAILYANKGYEYGEQIKSGYMKKESVEILSKAYLGMGDYKNALKYNVLHNQLLEEAYNEDNIKIIAQKEAEYDYNKKIKHLEFENEAKLYRSQMVTKMAIIASVLLFVIALVIFAFYRLKHKTNKLLIVKNQEILELNSELQKMNSTKDKFFSIVAHDLKNPIGNFMSISNLLYEEYELFEEDERRDYLKMINDNSKQLYALLENLLEWSRAQRGHIKFNPENYDYFLIANDCNTLLTIQAEKKKIILLNLVPHNTFAFIDKNLITTVTRNLLTNAVKFTPIGGHIEIGIQKNSTDNSSDDKQYITVYVKDSGVGMSGDTLANLFKIDANIIGLGTSGEKGTGLGLILCKEFILKHNGKIWVESILGKGTTFYFTLPINPNAMMK